jgi:hypothetical protein
MSSSMASQSAAKWTLTSVPFASAAGTFEAFSEERTFRKRASERAPLSMAYRTPSNRIGGWNVVENLATGTTKREVEIWLVCLMKFSKLMADCGNGTSSLI